MNNNVTPSSSTDPYFDNFRAGVTACLRSWSVLRTAVNSGWGSPSAADDLRVNILEHTHATTDVTDLEDALAIYMEEEFTLQLEDGSERQLADLICRLYRECVVQKSTVLLQQVVGSAEQAASHQLPIHIQASEHDEEDMATESTTTPQTAPAIRTETASSWSAAQYANLPLFGPPPKAPEPVAQNPTRQLGQDPAQEDDDMVVDDDGFAPVIKTRRR